MGNFVNYGPSYTNELVKYQMLMNFHLHLNHRVGYESSCGVVRSRISLERLTFVGIVIVA